MVEIAREMKPLRTRWQRIVIAIGSNGGGLEKRDAEQLRERLERLSAELDATIAEINGHGVQIKDIERGLVDFPAIIGDREVFLCWEKDEDDIEFWHDLDTGYAGREPL